MDQFVDTEVFDNYQNTSHGAEFVKGFSASFGGALLGAALDNTRFGIWFNTNPTIGWIYKKIGQVLVLGVIFLSILYIYDLIRIW